MFIFHKLFLYFCMDIDTFIDAAERGDEEGVRRGCEAGFVNTFGSSGWTAAMYAVNHRQLHILKILVEYGADLNLLTKDQQNSLIVACCGIKDINLNIAKYLLANGADPSIINKYGSTAAHYAAQCDSPECLRLVVVDDVLDKQDRWHKTVMDWAVECNINDCVDVLNSAYVWRSRRVLIMCIVKTLVPPIRNCDERLLDTRVIRRLGLIMSSYVMGMVTRFIPK